MAYDRPRIQVSYNLDAFFSEIIRKRFRVPDEVDWRVAKLKESIDGHPPGLPWRLKRVCKELGLAISPRQARRLFKDSIGMSIREYAKNRNLVAALEQLRTPSAAVKAIAADAGYRNTRNFARRFKQLFLLRPMEFRRLWFRRSVGV